MSIKQNSIFPLLLIFILPITIFLFNPAITETLLQHSFDDGTYSHAYLIPLIYLYLCYHLYSEKKLELRDRINGFYTLLFVLSCYVFFVTSSAQISLAYWLTHIFIIVTSTLMLFKYQWRIIFPAIYLIFMYPLWGPMVILLQEVSIVAVNILMGFTGIPTYVDKQFVSIPEGTFEIANGCSGLRYFITALAISSLYIFLYLNKAKHVLIFLFLAIAGSLIVNWLRITIIILVGHYTDMTSSLIEDHNMFGWYIFIPFMFFLFKFANTLGTDEIKRNSIVEQQAIPLNRLVVMISIVLIGITLSSTSLRSIFNQNIKNTGEQDQIKTDIFPIIPNYSQLNIAEKIINKHKFITHIYQFDGQNLDSKPSFYNNQLINYGWEVVEEDVDGRWHYKILAKKHQRSIIATNYEIDGQIEASKFKFKLLRLKKALLGHRRSQLNWIGSFCATDCMNEKNLLKLL